MPMNKAAGAADSQCVLFNNAETNNSVGALVAAAAEEEEEEEDNEEEGWGRYDTPDKRISCWSVCQTGGI